MFIKFWTETEFMTGIALDKSSNFFSFFLVQSGIADCFLLLFCKASIKKMENVTCILYSSRSPEIVRCTVMYNVLASSLYFS